MINENTLSESTSGGLRRWRSRLFNFAALAFFFLLPLQTRYIFRQPLEAGIPFEYGTLSIFLVEVLGWVVIALWAIKIKNEKLKIKNVWLLSLPFFTFLSIIWAPDKLVALQTAVRLLEGVLLYFVTSNSIRNWKLEIRNLLMWAFLAGAALQAGLGIYQFFSQASFASTLLGLAQHDPRIPGTAVVEFGQERWLRAYGGLPHPNVLGGYLAVALAVCYKRLQEVTRGYKRLLLQVMIPILLTGIFFSFSRSTWLAMALVLSCWVVTLRRVRDKAAAGFLVLVIGFVVFLVMTFRPLVVARLNPQNPGRLEVQSRVERTTGVREAWQLIKRHPTFGVGIGNYTQAIRREVRPGDFLVHYQPVHSVPFLVLAELGTVGLFIFLVALYTILQQSKFFILHSSFFILLLFDHYLWSLPFGVLLFWSILGLSTAYSKAPLDKKTAL